MNVLLVVLVLPIVMMGLFPVVLHWVYRAPRIVETHTPERLALPFVSQYLTGPKGKRLFSWLIPGEPGSHCVILVHGWGSNAEMMLPLAKPFHQAGMQVLLYDARNHGQSDSDSFSSLPRFAEDLGTAIEWVKDRYPGRKIVALGHSIGAAASLLAASHRNDIDLVISIAAFAHPDLVLRRHLDRPWLPTFMRLLIMRYIQWVIGYRFDDIAPMNRISHIVCPVLLAHGSQDRVVPISDMELIELNACSKRKVRALAIEGAQHDSVDDFERHAEDLIKFIHAHLDRKDDAVA